MKKNLCFCFRSIKIQNLLISENMTKKSIKTLVFNQIYGFRISFFDRTNI